MAPAPPRRWPPAVPADAAAAAVAVVDLGGWPFPTQPPATAATQPSSARPPTTAATPTTSATTPAGRGRWDGRRVGKPPPAVAPPPPPSSPVDGEVRRAAPSDSPRERARFPMPAAAAASRVAMCGGEVAFGPCMADRQGGEERKWKRIGIEREKRKGKKRNNNSIERGREAEGRGKAGAKVGKARHNGEGGREDERGMEEAETGGWAAYGQGGEVGIAQVRPCASKQQQTEAQGKRRGRVLKDPPKRHWLQGWWRRRQLLRRRQRQCRQV